MQQRPRPFWIERLRLTCPRCGAAAAVRPRRCLEGWDLYLAGHGDTPRLCVGNGAPVGLLRRPPPGPQVRLHALVVPAGAGLWEARGLEMDGQSAVAGGPKHALEALHQVLVERAGRKDWDDPVLPLRCAPATLWTPAAAAVPFCERPLEVAGTPGVLVGLLAA